MLNLEEGLTKVTVKITIDGVEREFNKMRRKDIVLANKLEGNSIIDSILEIEEAIKELYLGEDKSVIENLDVSQLFNIFQYLFTKTFS